MSELSVFIDESGEFGTNSDYYLLTLVFHNQNNSIDAELHVLDEKLKELGFLQGHTMHAGPIIRKEGEYFDLPLGTRRALLSRLFIFTHKAGITYKTFVVKKKEYPDRIKLKGRLARELSLFINDNLEYFASFDKVIAYYDNGQSPITELISTVFSSILFEVDFRKVKPSDYRLFQAADLLCMLELVAVKSREDGLSKSEMIFFETWRKLKKGYLDKLDRIRFK